MIATSILYRVRKWSSVPDDSDEEHGKEARIPQVFPNVENGASSKSLDCPDHLHFRAVLVQIPGYFSGLPSWTHPQYKFGSCLCWSASLVDLPSPIMVLLRHPYLGILHSLRSWRIERVNRRMHSETKVDLKSDHPLAVKLFTRTSVSCSGRSPLLNGSLLTWLHRETAVADAKWATVRTKGHDDRRC